jgi:hypothetical protein
MVTELQFAAVAAYLLWCLVSSLSGVLGPDQDAETPTGTCENNEITTAR